MSECEKCGGAGWVGGPELDDYDYENAPNPDDTRYCCDKCGDREVELGEYVKQRKNDFVDLHGDGDFRPAPPCNYCSSTETGCSWVLNRGCIAYKKFKGTKMIRTVRDLLRARLESEGYDGLYRNYESNHSCACTLDDMPCSELNEVCCAGYAGEKGNVYAIKEEAERTIKYMKDLIYLKIEPEYFMAILDGRKAWELRLDDRNYKVGNKLRLEEWAPGTKKYTGKFVDVEVIYLFDGIELDGDDWVIMSIKMLRRN